MMGPTRTHASLQDISFIGFPSYRSAILFIIPYNEISLDFFIDSNILDNFISLLLAETRPRTRAPHALYVSTNFIHTTPYSLPCFLRLMSFCSDALSWSRNGARCVFRISFGPKSVPKVRLWSKTITIYPFCTDIDADDGPYTPSVQKLCTTFYGSSFIGCLS